MHRTTTTATLLVTVAVSALAGCVTIQQPPAPVQPSAPAGPSVSPRQQPVLPPSAPEAEPQIVQAPAREALEMVGSPRHPTPTPPAPAGAPAAPHTPAHRGHPHPHDQDPHPHPPRPRAPHHPEQRRHPNPHSRPAIPDVPHTPPKNSDVCSLGRKYGGWRQDSAESTICDQTYGR
ncbi:hypothetical protein ACGFNV_37125 [Streptomyces sp. NPDC048751]|uniref:hypothetical protein n=1 Tax=Streptomyces sp. NPDC048751 TaxID=3365591 RepID=UPI00372120BE